MPTKLLACVFVSIGMSLDITILSPMLQRCVKEECPSPSLKLVLALLRLSNHDSEVFYKSKQVGRESSLHLDAGVCGRREQQGVTRVCVRVRERHALPLALLDVASKFPSVLHAVSANLIFGHITHPLLPHYIFFWCTTRLLPSAL